MKLAKKLHNHIWATKPIMKPLVRVLCMMFDPDKLYYVLA